MCWYWYLPVSQMKWHKIEAERVAERHRRAFYENMPMLKHGGIFYFSYSMYIQRVHGKVIWVLIEAVENLLESHLLFSLFQHHTASINLICFLDEGQEVFLRHAGSCMNMCVHLRDRNNVYVQSCKQIECLKTHTFLFLPLFLLFLFTNR